LNVKIKYSTQYEKLQDRLAQDCLMVVLIQFQYYSNILILSKNRL